MKNLFNIFAYFVLLFIVYVGVVNFDQNITLDIGAVKGLVDFGLPQYTLQLSVGLLTIVILATGFIISAYLIGQFYLAQKDKLSAYKRELEKSSVSNSTSSSKVEVLEAKIATLEKALDNAINNQK